MFDRKSSLENDLVIGTLKNETEAMSWNCMGVKRWNLLLNLRGNVRIENERARISAAAGDLILCAPSEKRVFTVSGPWETYWIHLTMKLPLLWNEAAPGFYLFHPRPTEFRRMIRDAMEAHRTAMESGGAWFPLAQHLVETIILRGNALLQFARNDRRLLPAVELLSRMKLNLNMDKLAEKCGMSRPSFYAKFKQAYNVPPHQYHENLKMRFVTDLLETTDLNFSDIAEQTGFPDLYYLSKRFKLYSGMSMSQYRKKHRAQ